MTRLVDPQVVIDNEHTRTVRWTLEPDTTIGHHVHPLPYIVVPLAAGTLTFGDTGGDAPSSSNPAAPPSGLRVWSTTSRTCRRRPSTSWRSRSIGPLARPAAAQLAVTG